MNHSRKIHVLNVKMRNKLMLQLFLTENLLLWFKSFFKETRENKSTFTTKDYNGDTQLQHLGWCSSRLRHWHRDAWWWRRWEKLQINEGCRLERYDMKTKKIPCTFGVVDGNSVNILKFSTWYYTPYIWAINNHSGWE